MAVKKRVAFKLWMPIGFLAAFVCCLSLAHAVVITDGYYKTCEQYRRNLIQMLNSGTRESEVSILLFILDNFKDWLYFKNETRYF